MEKILEEISKHRINPENLKDLNNDDKKYFFLNAGIFYVSGLNAIERGIKEHEKMIRSLVPEPIEDLKILLSRMADIKPSEIKDLSAGFLENLFTVNDRVLKVSLPEVGEVDEIEFKRFIVEQLKSSDEEVATANEIKAKIIKQMEEDIPEDCLAMLKNIPAMDDWMIGYFKRMIERADITDEQRENFANKLKAREKSYTLEPLKETISMVLNKTNSTDSIFHGYVKDSKRFLAAAVKLCSENHITFPFQLFAGIEETLFGDKYKDYKNLFLFLWARYLKHKGHEVNATEKIFITNLHAHIALFRRDDEWKKSENMLLLKKSIGEVLDDVISHKTK